MALALDGFRDSGSFFLYFDKLLTVNNQPQTAMKGCIQLIEGDPSSLVVSESVPMPSVGPYDILIRVSAVEKNARAFVLIC